jgi:hypothetical protein
MQQITFHRLLLFKRGTIGKKENSIALLIGAPEFTSFQCYQAMISGVGIDFGS